MATERIVDIPVLVDALDIEDIPTSSTDEWSNTKVKVKQPGRKGYVVKLASDIVTEKEAEIPGILSENLFFPSRFECKEKDPVFPVSGEEEEDIKKALESCDEKDAKEFAGTQNLLRGYVHEKIVYDAMQVLRFKCKYVHVAGLSLPHTRKLLKLGPGGGELDSLIVRSDMNFMYMEVKTQLGRDLLNEAAKQLKRGKSFLKALIGGIARKDAKLSKVSLYSYIYFGYYKTRAELETAIESKVPKLGTEIRRRLLCQEDLKNIEELLPPPGKEYEADYKQIVSILYTASHMAPANMTGSLAEWCNSLVGKEGTLPVETDESTPPDSHKFSTVRKGPLSSDHVMLFWTPKQIQLIRNFDKRCLLINGPFGSGKTQILRAFKKLLKGDPSIKVLMISGLEWSRTGTFLLPGVFMMDILSGSVTGKDIQKELNTDQQSFTDLVPKYIQHKLDTEDGMLAFIIDEVPLPKLSNLQEFKAWGEHWKAMTNSDRVILRIAIRTDCWNPILKIESSEHHVGFTSVQLNKVLRNTASVSTGAGLVMGNNNNFPIMETILSTISGDPPLLYIVEEEDDRLRVGAWSAYLENKDDMRAGVILCRDRDEVLATERLLQGVTSVTIFTGDKQEGHLAYAGLKHFFQCPTGILITTANCFTGMDSSCAMVTYLHLDRLYPTVDDNTACESQAIYRGVGKLILLVSRAQAASLNFDMKDIKGVLRKWDMRDAHDKTKIKKIEEFDTNTCRRKIEYLDRNIKEQDSKFQQLQQQQTEGQTKQVLSNNNNILQEIQEVKEHLIQIKSLYHNLGSYASHQPKQQIEIAEKILRQMHKIQDLHEKQFRDYSLDREQELGEEKEFLEDLQDLRKQREKVQSLKQQKDTHFTTACADELDTQNEFFDILKEIPEQREKIREIRQKQLTDYSTENEIWLVLQYIAKQNRKIEALHQQQVTDYSNERKQKLDIEYEILMVLLDIHKQSKRIRSFSPLINDDQEIAYEKYKMRVMEDFLIRRRTFSAQHQEQPTDYSLKLEFCNTKDIFLSMQDIYEQKRKVWTLQKQQVTDYSSDRQKELVLEKESLKMLQEIEKRSKNIYLLHHQQATNYSPEREHVLKISQDILLLMKDCKEQRRNLSPLAQKRDTDQTIKSEHELEYVNEILRLMKLIEQEMIEIQELHQKQITSYSPEREQELIITKEILVVIQDFKEKTVEIHELREQQKSHFTMDREQLLKEGNKQLLELRIQQRNLRIETYQLQQGTSKRIQIDKLREQIKSLQLELTNVTEKEVNDGSGCVE